MGLEYRLPLTPEQPVSGSVQEVSGPAYAAAQIRRFLWPHGAWMLLAAAALAMRGITRGGFPPAVAVTFSALALLGGVGFAVGTASWRSGRREASSEMTVGGWPRVSSPLMDNAPIVRPWKASSR